MPTALSPLRLSLSAQVTSQTIFPNNGMIIIQRDDGLRCLAGVSWLTVTTGQPWETAGSGRLSDQAASLLAANRS